MTKQDRVQEAATKLSDKLRAPYVVTIVLKDDEITVGCTVPGGNLTLVKALLKKTLEML